MTALTAPADPILLPPAPSLVAQAKRAVWVSADGEIEELSPTEAARRAETSAPLVCHAPATAARLGVKRLLGFDLLELFAFVRPARFCLPTPKGLAAAVGLPEPADAVAEAIALREAAAALLAEVRGMAGVEPVSALAQFLAQAGWSWSPAVFSALGLAAGKPTAPRLAIWNQLPEWQDMAPPPPAGHEPVPPDEALQRLARMLPPDAETRTPQRTYASEAVRAFAPRNDVEEPEIVLAEAGTGVGKTLGYIAPASVWAEKNAGTVWLSTYTRNLQRQIDGELARLFPDPRVRAQKVVVRKGRENYLCLLNLEEEASRAFAGGGVAVGLVARWAMATRDGDLGGDFPAWLVGVLGIENTWGLSDRRGECIYSACKHYKRCFIERSHRRARRAELVIANHALVLSNAARAADDRREMPTRLVFDEGHHLFDAADSAFSAHLTGQEAAELRRWVRGPEGGRHRRTRGLEQRAGDLVSGHTDAEGALVDAIRAAAHLPAAGWLTRLRDTGGSAVGNVAEAFLAQARAQILARQEQPDQGYDVESPAQPATPALLHAAYELEQSLQQLAAPLLKLARVLAARLDTEADTLETDTRMRIEAVCMGLKRRAAMAETWAAMLQSLEEGTPAQFVDWLSLERGDGREFDVGLHRHWVDPTQPFAEVVLRRVHGALITSASLRDQSTAENEDWRLAEVRTGAQHLALPARRLSLPSPFDYAGRTRILIVNDLARDSSEQVAAAYRELFLAAGGGGLGLFTAISRLRAVHRRMAEPLEEAGISLLAQHVDAMDTATLVDIFRAERDTCLLGTDAVRDGVDVPGDSLRLIVFDRVPWPRPDILHKARKDAFGGARYDDMIARLRLKQAYGRLIRKASDRGMFVLLDARTPTRLLSAFPKDVAVERVGIAEAVRRTRAFLQETAPMARPS